ncbi:MAG: DUF5103 domain-containing protein, partial [Bacteroidota bacterium]|nr:DUF5103 domain-containing protein [Bacteroidota bacterium]
MSQLLFALFNTLSLFQRSITPLRSLHFLPLLLAFLVIPGCASTGPAAASSGDPAPDYWAQNDLRMEDRVYSPTIHTVQLFKLGFELAPPIIELGSEDQLILRFDDLQPNIENLSYTVIHCDAYWKASDLLPGQYLTGALNDYFQTGRLSFNTLQQFIHYEVGIPNDMMQITRSGNYLLKVYRADDPEDLVLTRRFMIFEQQTQIDARILASRNVDLRDVTHQVDMVVRHPALPVQ